MSGDAMTLEQYKAIRDAHHERFMEVAKLLDAAGHDGVRILRGLRDAIHADDFAAQQLPLDDFLALLREEREERGRVLTEIGKWGWGSEGRERASEADSVVNSQPQTGK